MKENKEFYPDIVYNKGKRRLYFSLLLLAIVLVGGVSATFFVLGQTMIGLVSLVILVIAFATLPSAIVNYPVKNKPLIEVGGGKVVLYGKEEYKMNEVLVASVVIDVPPVRGTKLDKQKHLNAIASKRPTEPVTGACDVLVKDAKGKEVTKYNIVYDCLGALQALLDAGVKQYRIIYSMKRMSVKARYKVYPSGTGDSKKSDELTEKDKLMQLI